MKKEYYVYIGFVVIILVLLGVILTPKITEPFKAKYRGEGYNVCVVNMVNSMISDLQNRGFTEIVIANQTIRLGLLQ